MRKTKRILALILVICMVCGMLPAISAFAADEAEDKTYFMEVAGSGSSQIMSTVGSNAFNVFMYNNTFSGIFGDQKLSALELSLRGLRIATNGDLHLLPTPEQWDATPAPSKGTVVWDAENHMATVPMTYNTGKGSKLTYNLIVKSTEDACEVQMMLTSPMPADLQGKARFSFEFLPYAYKSKTYQADLNGDGVYDVDGIFPRHPQDALKDAERADTNQADYVLEWNEDRGDSQPLPFATGKGFSFSPEDVDTAIEIKSVNGDTLELYDGRNRAQNGWYVLSNVITATAAGEIAADWILKPQETDGWVKEPLVSHSQVGYATNQDKFAVVELDKYDTDYEKQISLWRVNADGTQTKVDEKTLDQAPTEWKRYLQLKYDFSNIKNTGLYCIHYGDQVTEIFPIADDVYDQSWQVAMTGYLTIAMNHITVREGYRVWHTADHMDDARLCGADIQGHGWFDGWSPASNTRQMALEIVQENGWTDGGHMLGMNQGGYSDAGDFDIQTPRNQQVGNNFVDTAEATESLGSYDGEAIYWDWTTGGLAEMRRPDGIPDIDQHVIHAAKFFAGEFNANGCSGGTIEVVTLRQYTHLGSGDSETDGYIYDPKLEPNEIWVDEATGLTYSGRNDDRYDNSTSAQGGNHLRIMAAGAYYAARAYSPDMEAKYEKSYRETAQYLMYTANRLFDKLRGTQEAAASEYQYLAELYMATKMMEAKGLSYKTADLSFMAKNKLPYNANFDASKYNHEFYKARLASIIDSANVSSYLYSSFLIYDEMDEAFRDKVDAAAKNAMNANLFTNIYGVNGLCNSNGWGNADSIINGVEKISQVYNFYKVHKDNIKDRTIVDNPNAMSNILTTVDYILGCHPGDSESWVSGVGAVYTDHAYDSNRADESYMPGNINPGYIVWADYAESLKDYNLMWIEGESIINYQAAWVSVGFAASNIAHNLATEEVPAEDNKDFVANLDAKLVDKSTSGTGWGGNPTVTQEGYLADNGFNMFMYSTQFDRGFGDQHCAGIELVQNGRRVATNGDIHLLPTPEQWDATPAPTFPTAREFDFETNTATVNVQLPAETFTDGTPENPAVDYQLISTPVKGGIKMTVKLDEDLPADLVGKAGLNLEFLPAVYVAKSFQTDTDGDGTYDDFGMFPGYPKDDMEIKDRARTNNQAWYVKQWNEERGDYQPVALTEGKKMTFAAEDDDYRIRIECEDGLALYDGRNRSQNGWFVLRTLIPEGKKEVSWYIYPDTDNGWTREPNISHSQVGYEPELDKVAVIELDPEYEGGNTATLKRLNADGSLTDVFTAQLGEATSWKRYVYRNFDFSEFKTPGTYVIDYDGYVSDSFPIKKGAYDGTWQQSLSDYMAIQMDHMRIRDGYKIWRSAAHMDDALQGPLESSWFDAGGMSGSVIESGIGINGRTEAYKPGEHIPGLNVGGFCDAGDYDIQTGQNVNLIRNLYYAYKEFDTGYDTLDVDWDGYNNVELHRPDGTADIVQLIKHGILQILGQYENIGFLASILEVQTLRQYTQIGSSNDTDNKVYDPTLEENEVWGMTSGKKDDRYVFASTKNASTNLGAAEIFAQSYMVLKDYDKETADRCLAAAEKIWNEEPDSHVGTESEMSFFGMTFKTAPADWGAAVALLEATGKDVYKDRVAELFDVEMQAGTGGGFFGGGASFTGGGWKAYSIVDQLGEEAKAKFEAAVAAYAPTIAQANQNNPYGIPNSDSMWGGSMPAIQTAFVPAILHNRYPDVVPADQIFKVVNYILGTHPYNSTSWVSCVGNTSVELGYGSNRCDNYFIAGGVAPGYVTIAPDFPEHMDDFQYLWFENEYTVEDTSNWILVAQAAQKFARENDVPCEHEYTATVTEPGCVRGGYTTYFCEKCFDTYQADETEPLGHDWDDGVITKAPLAVFEGEATFTCQRCGLQRVEVVAPLGGKIDMSDIDFTDAANNDRFAVDFGDAAITDGTGLHLASTTASFETSGSDFAPNNVIKIPVTGDWTATLKYTGAIVSPMWSFGDPSDILGFYVMDNLQNGVGIRADNKNMKSFTKTNGTVKTAAGATTGLDAQAQQWLRIDKDGDTYVCSNSLDGENFTELFTFEGSGIEGKMLVIDAYNTGWAFGGSNSYDIEYLAFEVKEPEGVFIDFTNPADAEKFDIVGQATAAIEEGVGLPLISTKTGVEPANGQNSGDAATTPADLVEVPVEGDWTATLNFEFDENGSRGWYEFFGFYAAEGDDYQNMAGIRGGDGAMQDFLRKAGAVTADTDGVKTSTGLKSAADHWLRIVKEGDKYICYWSTTGEENLAEIFAYEATGIEAEKLIIDAYTGMAAGYKYTLKSLDIEYAGGPEEPVIPEVEEVPIEHPELPIYENTEYTFAERAADLVARMSPAQKGTQMVSTASAIPASNLGNGALNVPGTKNIDSYEWWSEALHGYSRGNTGGAVSYPQNLTVASTWNPELYYREAVQIGDEIREKTSKNSQTGNAKNLNFYSPTVNMHRDPRWGRNEESFSEDVYLTGKMASEFVLGVEGKDREGNLLDPDGYKKAMCTVKHYAANNSERNRLSGGAVSDLRAIREYYTAPYREVIQQADVQSVMTAYSTLNGEPTSYSSYLMDTLLRQTFGFSGHITSDCDSAATQNRHGYVNPYTGDTMTDLEALAGALAHGEDLECNGGYSGFGTYSSKMTKMLDAAPMTDKGTFTENAVDVSLARLMEARISTGEFDDNLAYTAAAAERTAAQNGSSQTAERLAIVEEIDNEGVVMLKNNGLLPLNVPAEGDYNVAIVGAWQTNNYLGLYSNSPGNQLNIQQGIVNALKAVREDINFTLITSDTLNADNEAAIAAADVAIVVTGTNSNYSKEDGDRNSIKLPNNLDTLISNVGKLNANTIAIMETCGEMQVKTFENDVAAILWSSFEGMRKVGFGNVISGAVNPSGKLTDTWYQDVNDSGESDIPSILDYNMYATNGSNGRTYMYYVGEKKPSYVFGYGLSYTTFEYSNLTIDKTAYDANETVKVSFNVKNTGDVAGKEITQLYIAQPDAPAELLRPIKRLEGFDKIELQPGESKTVTMEVAIPDLAFFSEENKRYEVDTGKYQVQVGTNSEAAANLTKDFTVSGTMDVYPELLTVKANQVGDTEMGIEERVIFDKGAIINPQLTVAMNDESLWGYVIAHQMSPIDQVKSSELPKGMKFYYTTNRPSVVSVKDGVIKAENAGVATIKVTGILDDYVVTTDFVVYVEATSDIDGITLDGKPLEGFNREKYAYELDSADFEKTPVVGYIANTEGLDVTVEQFTDGVATITSVETASGTTSVYRLGMGPAPVSTDFAEGWEAAEAKGWTLVGEAGEFGENGLTVTDATGFYSEPAFGTWAAQGKVTLAQALANSGDRAGFIVKDTDDSYVLLVYELVKSTGWWSSTNYYVTAYALQDGTLNQIARSGNIGSQTEVNLRVIKQAGAFTFSYSVDGINWTDMNGTAKVSMADPKIAPYVTTGVTATFDGINVCKVSQLYPRLASVKLNGATLADFDPEKFIYNFAVEADAAAPVLEATAADEETKVEITQLDATTGMATIRAYNDVAEATYSFYFGFAPKSDYFADGDFSDDWTIEREDDTAYSVDTGKGVVMPTQQGDIHGTGGAWKNCFTAPAQGNWQAVAKVVYPNVPTANYQQAMFLVWQDENNYLRMNCQTSNLGMEPGVETNGSFNGNLGSGQAIPAEDGTVTLYFLIDKADNNYTVGYSQDGVNFTMLNTAKNVNFANPRIGLFVTQNSSSTPMNMYFEYVAVTWLNGVEQMTKDQMMDWASQNVADYVAAAVPEATTEDIEFAAVPHGYTMEVTSSDPSVIAPDGTVNVPASGKKVTLTIKVSDAVSEATSVAEVQVGEAAAPAYKQVSKVEAGKTYVIVANDAYALNNTAASDTKLGATAVTVEGDTITSPVTEDMLWTFKPAEGASAAVDGREQFFVYDQAGGQLVRQSGSTGTAPMVIGTPKKPNYATWSAAERNAETGEFTFYVNSNSNNDYPFTMNGGADGFNAPGTSRSNWDPTTYGASVKFYELVGEPTECDHDYVAVVTKPTCTEAGYTTYTCSKCGDSYVADEVEALGHDYKAVVTAPTCTEAGYTTYTCARCEDSYVADEVAALGHDYVDGYCTRCGEIDPEYTPDDPEELLKAAQAAAKAAQEAQKAAEAAKKAAEEAAAAAGADSAAAEAAKKAAEEAQKKAEAAQAAAEAAKKAAETADADAAVKAAESAASAAESAASAAEAAKAQAAAAQAQAKAEEAQKAAEEAQKKADEAAATGEAAADEAAAAQKAAEEAKKAAQDAKNAADVSAKAAEDANAEAAEAAAKAAADAAKIADALKQVAAAQAEVADAVAKAAKDAENAAKERAAAEAAQKAAEAAAKVAKEAELNAAKYNALTQAALAAAGAEDVDPAAFEAGVEAIQAAKTVDEVEDALKDLLEKLGYDVSECPSAKFIDAPAKDNWAHEGIDFCVANDYMNGVSANVFSPEGTVTRAQLVTILYRVAGSPATEFKGTFSDVADGQWYSAAIEWAAANGVVLGVGEGKFAPDGEITREQIATILFRYSKADKVEGDLKAFPDGDTAGDFAVDGLIWAVKEGLITGVKNGDVTNLAPKDNATREQIAAIIMRFLDGSYDCK